MSQTFPRHAADPPTEPEPRWPAVIAVVAVALLYLALPASMSVGPSWLAPAIILSLAAGTVITHRQGYCDANHLLGHILSSVLTLFMIWSLVLLVRALPAHKESP